MNTSSPNNTNTFKALLREQLIQIYGFRGEIIPRKDFLHHSWNGIDSFVKHQRHFPLIRDAVKEHRDFIARMHVILTIQYGAYTHEPDIVSMIKDLIDLLGKNLDKEEEKVCEYAAQTKFPYFPGLIETWKGIEQVYSEKHLDHEVLPRTPHLAYALFTLNNAESIGRKLSSEEMFGKLARLSGQMNEIHEIVRDSQHRDTGSSADVLEFKRPSS